MRRSLIINALPLLVRGNCTLIIYYIYVTAPRMQFFSISHPAALVYRAPSATNLIRISVGPPVFPFHKFLVIASANYRDSLSNLYTANVLQRAKYKNIQMRDNNIQINCVPLSA